MLAISGGARWEREQGLRRSRRRSDRDAQQRRRVRRSARVGHESRVSERRRRRRAQRGVWHRSRAALLGRGLSAAARPPARWATPRSASTSARASRRRACSSSRTRCSSSCRARPPRPTRLAGRPGAAAAAWTSRSNRDSRGGQSPCARRLLQQRVRGPARVPRSDGDWSALACRPTLPPTHRVRRVRQLAVVRRRRVSNCRPMPRIRRIVRFGASYTYLDAEVTRSLQRQRGDQSGVSRCADRRVLAARRRAAVPSSGELGHAVRQLCEWAGGGGAVGVLRRQARRQHVPERRVLRQLDAAAESGSRSRRIRRWTSARRIASTRRPRCSRASRTCSTRNTRRRSGSRRCRSRFGPGA